LLFNYNLACCNIVAIVDFDYIDAFVKVSVLPLLIGCALFGLITATVMERRGKV
jgi:hypothetical protein